MRNQVQLTRRPNERSCLEATTKDASALNPASKGWKESDLTPLYILKSIPRVCECLLIIFITLWKVFFAFYRSLKVSYLHLGPHL